MLGHLVQVPKYFFIKFHAQANNYVSNPVKKNKKWCHKLFCELTTVYSQPIETCKDYPDHKEHRLRKQSQIRWASVQGLSSQGIEHLSTKWIDTSK